MDERESKVVAEAFESLLKALEEDLEKISQKEGVKALQQLKFLEQIKGQVQWLYESWQSGRMVQPKPSPGELVSTEVESADRDPTAEWLSRLICKSKRQRVYGGIPAHAFRPYILKALAQLGGSAREADALKRVEEMVKLRLLPVDLEWMPKGNDYRWRKKARWERFKMKQDGLLRDDSPRGIWELTEKGWQEVRKLLENEG
ncbi:MAG: winged helix-turn-helix domain-containing protein [Armatimonadetes bacterium]|nr:winged helix-turn-helix domain-containing protein [Armatimonadota bacterium]